MDGFVVERAGAAQAKPLGRVQALSWQAAYKGVVPDDFLAGFTPQARAEVLARFIGGLPEEYYLARLDGAAVGMLALGAAREQDLPGAGEIQALYLLPECWQKGYGRQMMDFALGRLAQLGLSPVILWVLAENTRARAFYGRCGFAADGGEKQEHIGGATLPMVRYQKEKTA